MWEGLRFRGSSAILYGLVDLSGGCGEFTDCLEFSGMCCRIESGETWGCTEGGVFVTFVLVGLGVLEADPRNYGFYGSWYVGRRVGGLGKVARRFRWWGT